jgi:hypothetical protein
MNRVTGADHPLPPEEPSLPDATRGFVSAAIRFLRAMTGLFGLELRETGGHALALAGLAVAAIFAGVFAYLFLLLAIVMALSSWFGGGWLAVMLVLFVFHLVLAGALVLVLRGLAMRPLFPGTREAMRRELERLS